MKMFSKLAVAVALLSAACGGARADSTVLNTGLASPPGTYYGGGNTNDHWTVTNTSGGSHDGIELGLRAVLRNVGSITPTANVYFAPAGAGSPGRATWNFDFSLNLGSTGLKLSDFDGSSSMTITDLSNPSITRTFNPFAVADSRSYNGSTFQNHSTADPLSNHFGTEIAFQNSENITFGEFIPPGFNLNAETIYDIKFNLVGDSDGSAAGFSASDEIFVNTSPLPSVGSMGTAMLGLAGLGVVYRARTRKLAANPV